jgi:hypothetical protein
MVKIHPIEAERIYNDTQKSILDMDYPQRVDWLLNELIERTESQAQAIRDMRRTLPWQFAIVIIASFVLGLCFAKWWWGIA